MAETQKPENFESALNELEEIVQKLEQGDLPLDDALSSFKRGIELSQYCQKTLTEAEQTVAKMITDQGEVLLEGE